MAHPALAVWLCLADGMVEHFRNQSAIARDRIQRAYALAGAARLRPLIALSAAWLDRLERKRALIGWEKGRLASGGTSAD